jgi:tetratricopeptide (TPR) repeat protein
MKGIRLNESGLMPSNPNSPDPIPSMYYSAQSCMAQGEYAQARKLLQILSDENLVAAHPEMPLRVQLMLPVVTGLQGDYEKAAEEFATSVKIWNQAKAWNSLSMSESYAYLNTYADVLRHTGREERADAVQRQADALEKQMQARLPDMLVGPIRWWNTKKESP